MEWQIVLAMIVAAPIILLPVACIWWLNFGEIRRMTNAERRKKAKAEETNSHRAAGTRKV